jgi:hypothetical protein
MPFDPSKPANNSPLVSQVVRDQFNALKALVDAIVTIVAAQIDAVNTLNPGDPAMVSVSVVGDTLHFTFAIPRGNDGAQGTQGDPGGPGPVGPQGPPFAQAIVDAVNTLTPGSPATVSVTFDGTNVRFTFGIPAGQPGEVTTAALDAAIATTALNPSGIGPFTGTFSDPPMQAEMQAFAAYVESLRTATVR